MKSATKIIEAIQELIKDPEKFAAAIDIAINSENEEIRDKLLDLWFTLLMTHGEEVAEAVEKIEKDRDFIERQKERKRKEKHDSFLDYLNQKKRIGEPKNEWTNRYHWGKDNA